MLTASSTSNLKHSWSIFKFRLLHIHMQLFEHILATNIELGSEISKRIQFRLKLRQLAVILIIKTNGRYWNPSGSSKLGDVGLGCYIKDKPHGQ